jgi:hypothetical protein
MASAFSISLISSSLTILTLLPRCVDGAGSKCSGTNWRDVVELPVEVLRSTGAGDFSSFTADFGSSMTGFSSVVVFTSSTGLLSAAGSLGVVFAAADGFLAAAAASKTAFRNASAAGSPLVTGPFELAAADTNGMEFDPAGLAVLGVVLIICVAGAIIWLVALVATLPTTPLSSPNSFHSSISSRS